MTYTDKHRNRITVQDNGLISITPKNESTRFYDLKEIVDAVKKQIPSKPKIGNDNGRERKCCSSCGCFFLPTSKYCSKCGQRIDYGERTQ